MNKVIFYFFILQFYCHAAFPQDAAISKEQFVNEIAGQLMDTGFSKFYLFNRAEPCSFKKFDYQQLLQYALIKMVPINVLNELAKNCYADTAKDFWQQEKISKCVCIDAEKTESFVNPVEHIWKDQSLTRKEKKKAAEQTAKEWLKKPITETSFFNFSKPVFTDDHQYAVMNVIFHSLDYTTGSTYIFELNENKWEIVGKIPGWDNTPYKIVKGGHNGL